MTVPSLMWSRGLIQGAVLTGSRWQVRQRMVQKPLVTRDRKGRLCQPDLQSPGWALCQGPTTCGRSHEGLGCCDMGSLDCCPRWRRSARWCTDGYYSAQSNQPEKALVLIVCGEDGLSVDHLLIESSASHFNQSKLKQLNVYFWKK